MRISKKGEYALRAMMYLAARGGTRPVRIREIARAQRIPEKFLERILLDLRKAGILSSVRGRGGGYALGRRAEEITLAAVVRVIDGPLAPLRCASTWARRRCPAERGCGLHDVMLDVRNAIAGVLETISLADVLRRTARLRGKRVGRRSGGAPVVALPEGGCVG
ncbi:MAG: Rrf2 family transcriptional regulator [bacterium]|nr:Rrf2 family transcriptional regulator [bacterium]